LDERRNFYRIEIEHQETGLGLGKSSANRATHGAGADQCD
jgi:hypothetical protein